MIYMRFKYLCLAMYLYDPILCASKWIIDYSICCGNSVQAAVASSCWKGYVQCVFIRNLVGSVYTPEI